MLPDWVSNPGPLTYESGALLIALHGPADFIRRAVNNEKHNNRFFNFLLSTSSIPYLCGYKMVLIHL